MKQEELNNIFTYHSPVGDQAERYGQLRACGKSLAESIVALTPSSREQTIAIRKVQEAVMFANAAIAINESG